MDPLLKRSWATGVQVAIWCSTPQRLLKSLSRGCSHHWLCDLTQATQIPGYYHTQGAEVGRRHNSTAKHSRRGSSFWSSTLWSLCPSSPHHSLAPQSHMLFSILPALQESYGSTVRKCANKIITDPFCPGHHLLQPFPSSRVIKVQLSYGGSHGGSHKP